MLWLLASLLGAGEGGVVLAVAVRILTALTFKVTIFFFIFFSF